MKMGTGGCSSIRCFLLIACVAAILAADDRWLGYFSLDRHDAHERFADMLRNNTSTSRVADAAEVQSSLPSRTHVSLTRAPGELALSQQRRALDWLSNPLLHLRDARMAWIDSISQPASGVLAPSHPAAESIASICNPAVTTLGVPSPSATTTGSAQWIGDLDGPQLWSNPRNWSPAIPDGTGAIADLSHFAQSGDRNVTLDSPRTLGQLYLGEMNGAHHYDITNSNGAALTFADSSGLAFIVQAPYSAGDSIAVPILMQNDLAIQNNSTTNLLTVGGSIQSVGGSRLLRFSLGSALVSADISNGTTGNSIAVLKSSSGTVTLSGTNTYSGATTVNGGTLLINGDQSGARGSIAVSKSGSILGGSGTIGGRVTINSGATITGGATGAVGTLTLNNSLFFVSGTYLADLSGASSDKLAITGALNLTGGGTLTLNGSVDGMSSYVLATYSDGHTGEFTASNLPADYSLVYGANELDLVPLTPVPEPATWFGGLLGLGAVGFSQRRRFARRHVLRRAS